MVNDKKTHLAEKKQNKKSNDEQSDLCGFEQVNLKPQLQFHHCLTVWLQTLYHSLPWGDSIRERVATWKSRTAYSASTPKYMVESV